MSQQRLFTFPASVARLSILAAKDCSVKSTLRTLWLLATGAGIMALWILTLETFAGKLSMFLIWLTLFVLLGGLTLYTVKLRKPAKKKMPIRRAKRNLKIVGR